jgi:hypothetical protein
MCSSSSGISAALDHETRPADLADADERTWSHVTSVEGGVLGNDEVRRGVSDGLRDRDARERWSKVSRSSMPPSFRTDESWEVADRWKA